MRFANFGSHLADLRVRFVVRGASYCSVWRGRSPGADSFEEVHDMQRTDTWPDQAYWRGFRLRLFIGLGVTFGILGAWLATLPAGQRDAMLNYWGRVRVPAPGFDLAPLFAAPLSVQVHVACAVAALVVGAIIFLLPKGTGFHRALGWTWVSSMIVVAATSVAMIADFRNGVNALHIFTVLTVVSLWAGLAGIRRGDVRTHAGSMVGLYIGGLIIAGITAFIPGRTMWQVIFGG